MKLQIHKIGLLLMVLSFASSCEDFLAVDPPRTELGKEGVFSSYTTANAAMLAVYNQMVFSGFASGGVNSATYLLSMSADEMINYNTTISGLPVSEFNQNSLLPSNQGILLIWTELYQYIYKANAILEGLSTPSEITQAERDRLTGEAKFIRAFSHFYLVSLFGAVPVVTSTDYQVNASISRSPVAEVYDQIVEDLISAETLLPSDFTFSANERVRPTQAAARALLARTYLFTGNWADAESKATAVIEDPQFALQQNLNDVFLKNSTEAIFQLRPPSTNQNTLEANVFVFTGHPVNGAMSEELHNGFEAGDSRRVNWIGMTEANGVNYYYPFKYKVVGGTNPLQEYSVVLRLAEQFLIRAEARLNQGKVTDAIDDVNEIRLRAGLAPLDDSLTADEVLLAIYQERRSELFAEWGHRWLDLKRTGLADNVLSPIKEDWQPTDVLFPIPLDQIQKNPSMANDQNPGY